MHERRHSLSDVLIVFAGLTLAMVVLGILSSGFSGQRLSVLADPVGWVLRLQPTVAFEILSNAAEVVAGVLGIAITVVAIVLELAANRYSHRFIWIFIRDPVNVAVLSLFILTTLQCVWVGASMSGPTDAVAGGAEGINWVGVSITLTMVTMSLLSLLPYFTYVFAFLSPLNMIEKIRHGALTRIDKVKQSNLERYQGEVEEAVDELQEIARSATDQGDRSIAMAAVDALMSLLEDYHARRESLPPEWFKIGPSVAADPDFIALAPSATRNIEEEKLWLEVKIMLQYLALIGHCLPRAKDVANLIAINTHRIATGVGLEHPDLRWLCMRCMNSYLRTTINARDARTSYYIINQYRLIAEKLLGENLHDEVIQIAGFLKFYGGLGFDASIPFLLETAAHDLVELIEADLALDAQLTDRLLSELLDLDREIKEESHVESLLGVRRSQMQLASLFLVRGEMERAQRIAVDLATEPASRLRNVWQQLTRAQSPQYWEFTARGINFSYLPEERRAVLPRLIEMVAEARRVRSIAGTAGPEGGQPPGG